MDDALGASKPSAATTAVAAKLQAGLNPKELENILAIDWNTVTAAQLVATPGFSKAMRIVAAGYSASSSSALSVASEALMTEAVGTCETTCDACEQKLDAAINRVRDRFKRYALPSVATCAAIGAATGGIGGVACGAVALYMLLSPVSDLVDSIGCSVESFTPKSLATRSLTSSVNAAVALIERCSDGDRLCSELGRTSWGTPQLWDRHLQKCQVGVWKSVADQTGVVCIGKDDSSGVVRDCRLTIRMESVASVTGTVCEGIGVGSGYVIMACDDPRGTVKVCQKYAPSFWGPGLTGETAYQDQVAGALASDCFLAFDGRPAP